jgi:hypothetical protein
VEGVNEAMKSKLKIVAAILAFSLGVAAVWTISRSSFFTPQVEQPTLISEGSPQLNESISQLDPVETENTLSLELELRFEDFPVNEIYKGKNVPLKFKKDVLGYEERLQLAINNQDVNFAGRYVATNWSCGMWCSMNAFIDAKTGKVYWSPVTTEVCLPHLPNEFVCDESFSSVRYKVDSNLVVFFGFRYDENPDGEKGFHYYKIDSGRFIHLKSVPVKEQRSARQIQIDEFDHKSK